MTQVYSRLLVPLVEGSATHGGAISVHKAVWLPVGVAIVVARLRAKREAIARVMAVWEQGQRNART